MLRQGQLWFFRHLNEKLFFFFRCLLLCMEMKSSQSLMNARGQRYSGHSLYLYNFYLACDLPPFFLFTSIEILSQ